MARLNDPPAFTGETIDALKRRFIRQNRELARVNSTQSIRIRTLESEVSTLLAENVMLRQEIIRQKYESDHVTAPKAWEKVDALKHSLESRLSDLGNLIQELGNVQSSACQDRPSKRKLQTQISPKRSPTSTNWRPGGQVSCHYDGQLPPIQEDKQYPRRTLDQTEIQNLLTNTDDMADSPELGPPPIAHLDETDPITFGIVNKETDPDVEKAISLSTDLENRKKRRESFRRQDSSSTKEGKESCVSNTIGVMSKTSQTLKTGAKRKLNAREEEEQRTAEEVRNDNRYFRKSGDDYAETNNKSSTASISALDPRSSRGRTHDRVRTNSSVEGMSTRKILGPKTVNSDPKSPAKLSRSQNKVTVHGNRASEDLGRKGLETNKARSRAPATRIKEAEKETEAQHTAPSLVLDLPPKTPLPSALDLSSPSTSDPSEPRPGTRDTPPPPDLGPDTGTGSFGRASRRSRGSISYAEPSLRDKMRRPTKELVDAVITTDKKDEAVATRSDAAMPSTSHRVRHTERHEAISPLGKKATLTEMPLSAFDRPRQRRTSVFAPSSTSTQDPLAAAADLVQSNRSSGGSIFDFTGSSPDISSGLSTSRARDEKEDPKKMRVSRRHSTSVPSLGAEMEGIARRKQRVSSLVENMADSIDEGDGHTGRIRTAHGNANEELVNVNTGMMSRRRSMML